MTILAQPPSEVMPEVDERLALEEFERDLRRFARDRSEVQKQQAILDTRERSLKDRYETLVAAGVIVDHPAITVRKTVAFSFADEPTMLTLAREKAPGLLKLDMAAFRVAHDMGMLDWCIGQYAMEEKRVIAWTPKALDLLAEG